MIRAAGIEEMLDLCDAFAHLPAPAGRRVAIVTNSGGPGILAADRAEELGLEVAEPSSELQAGLRGFLSERCAVGNPVDLTVEGSGANYERTLRLLLDGGYDAAIAVNVSTPFLDSVDLARGVIAARDAGPAKPIAAVFAAGEVVAEAVRVLQQAGVPCFPSGERAALALARLREREELLADARRAPRGPLPEPRPLPWPPAEPAASGLVPEPDAWAFLRDLGLPLPRVPLHAAPRPKPLRPPPRDRSLAVPPGHEGRLPRDHAQERPRRRRAGTPGSVRGETRLQRHAVRASPPPPSRGRFWPSRWPAAWK